MHPGRKQPERAQVKRLVTTYGAGDGVLAAGERRRIEDDEVERRLAVLGEPVEDVGDLERGGEAVALGGRTRGGDGVLGRVEAEHAGRAGLRAGEAEAALVAEGVEHAAALGELGDVLMLVELVEVGAGLLAAHEVDADLHAADLHPRRLERPARDRADLLAQTLELARRSEEHTSELQSLRHLVCRLLLEKKKHTKPSIDH